MQTLGWLMSGAALCAVAAACTASSTAPDNGWGYGSSGAGASSGADSGSGSSGGSSSGSSGRNDAGEQPGEACQQACGENARCSPSTDSCRCLPGFVDAGNGNCSAAPAGTPASHSESDVCARWSAGHTTTAAGNGWSEGAAQCNPGTLSREAIDDAVARINTFRWLHGLAPVVDDEAGHARAMACSTVGAWNPPGSGFSPHSPPPSATCYTEEGASGAGESNMAWGSNSAADAMDQWVRDNGNDTTLGHRRWIMNPAMGKTAIGFYAGGGRYGSASCMSSFDGSGTGPSPEWMSFPPEGYAPAAIVSWIWSVHVPDANAGTLVVRKSSDGQQLALTKLPLQGNYGGRDAVGYKPVGWEAEAGETYQATFTRGDLTLEWNVIATDCP